MLAALVLLGLNSPAAAFYEGGSSDVTVLTPANFDDIISKSDGVYVVEFYAQWCGKSSMKASHRANQAAVVYCYSAPQQRNRSAWLQ